MRIQKDMATRKGAIMNMTFYTEHSRILKLQKDCGFFKKKQKANEVNAEERDNYPLEDGSPSLIIIIQSTMRMGGIQVELGWVVNQWQKASTDRCLSKVIS
jgi:hypothetical protein